MSKLVQLQVTAVRNILQADLECSPTLNFLVGANGSGKTSLLEAIFFLARGRSFRTSNPDAVVSRGSPELVVFAVSDDGTRLGLSRGSGVGSKLRFDGESESNWDRVARKLPLTLLDAGAFRFLEDGPRARRQLLDWGVFHVEPQFLGAWRRYQKALAQRNRLLKISGVSVDQLTPWEEQMSMAGEEVDQLRSSYLAQLLPVFEDVYSQLSGDFVGELRIDYKRGWDRDHSLSSALSSNRESEFRYRATQFGPQRADLVLKVGALKALDVASRGQQKILVSALKLAQGELMRRQQESPPIYLVDDLPAELDSDNREQVLAYLMGLDAQVFATSVSESSLTIGGNSPKDPALFHVERGKISR